MTDNEAKLRLWVENARPEEIELEIGQCGYIHKFSAWDIEDAWHLILSFNPNAIHRWPNISPKDTFKYYHS